MWRDVSQRRRVTEDKVSSTLEDTLGGERWEGTAILAVVVRNANMVTEELDQADYISTRVRGGLDNMGKEGGTTSS